MMQAALINTASLSAALLRCCDALEAGAAELNALDARLGDGDLGTTLSKCAANLRAVLTHPASSLQALLRDGAQACAKASGSSFGTLLAVAFLTASRGVAARDGLDRAALVQILDDIAHDLMKRGGATPGDKTMVDSLLAITQAMGQQASESPEVLKNDARVASEQALKQFRDLPNRMGRARMFAERSVGMDDPGMVAVHRLVLSI